MHGADEPGAAGHFGTDADACDPVGAEVDKAGETVLQNIVRGKITPLEGKTLSGILEERRRVIETGDLSERIEKLEEDAAGKRAQRGPR